MLVSARQSNEPVSPGEFSARVRETAKRWLLRANPALGLTMVRDDALADPAAAGAGVLVKAVTAGGAADEAGLRAGMAILSVDGVNLKRSSQLSEIFRGLVAGQKVLVVAGDADPLLMAKEDARSARGAEGTRLPVAGPQAPPTAPRNLRTCELVVQCRELSASDNKEFLRLVAGNVEPDDLPRLQGILTRLAQELHTKDFSKEAGLADFYTAGLSSASAGGSVPSKAAAAGVEKKAGMDKAAILSVDNLVAGASVKPKAGLLLRSPLGPGNSMTLIKPTQPAPPIANSDAEIDSAAGVPNGPLSKLSNSPSVSRPMGLGNKVSSPGPGFRVATRTKGGLFSEFVRLESVCFLPLFVICPIYKILYHIFFIYSLIFYINSDSVLYYIHTQINPRNHSSHQRHRGILTHRQVRSRPAAPPATWRPAPRNCVAPSAPRVPRRPPATARRRRHHPVGLLESEVAHQTSW